MQKSDIDQTNTNIFDAMTRFGLRRGILSGSGRSELRENHGPQSCRQHVISLESLLVTIFYGEDLKLEKHSTAKALPSAGHLIAVRTLPIIKIWNLLLWIVLTLKTKTIEDQHAAVGLLVTLN